MHAIECAEVSKRYCKGRWDRFAYWLAARRALSPNWFWVLNQVSLAVAPGQRLGLIGANGAGKTTLLRIIAGVTEPTAGTVRVRGRVVPLLELGAGIVPDLTGRENIYLNGIILGMRRREIQRKFDAIVEFSGVGRFLDMPLKYYSLGMTMRLGFSVAAHVDAEILLVDEALSVGDAAFQGQVYGRLRQMCERGATMILVSHDASIIERLTDEVLWLHGGRVSALGPSAQVMSAYLNAVRQGPSGQSSPVVS